MKKIALITLALLFASSAFAQAPTTTAPNVSNTVSQCSANTPVVGNGAGIAPKCHASGALGTAAFANTGTSGATIGLLNAANTWSATQAFAAITATTFNGMTFSGSGTVAFGTGGTITYNPVTSVATAGLATGGPITGTGTVTVTAAAKSDQQAAGSSVLAVTPSQQQSHPSAAKGWAFFNGVTTVSIGASYNVSGIVRSSAGNYTLTWATPFATANYAAIVQCNDNGSGAGAFGLLESTSVNTVVFVCVNPSTLTAADASKVSVVSFGGQ